MHIPCSDEQQQEAIAALLELEGFEGFEYLARTLVSYVPEPEFDEAAVQSVLNRFAISDFTHNPLPDTNWNAAWEASMTPIEIGDFCQIVPEFMPPKPGFSHTLIITPKTAFGTGHHQTTRLMIRLLQQLDLQQKKVLDHGCGTGVLGMLCWQMGARQVDFVDHDPACTLSTTENLADNKLPASKVNTGDISAAPNSGYELLIANINRNVLLAEAAEYLNLMAPQGRLLLSGFLAQDLEHIRAAYQSLGFQPHLHLSEDDWQSLAFLAP